MPRQFAPKIKPKMPDVRSKTKTNTFMSFLYRNCVKISCL